MKQVVLRHAEVHEKRQKGENKADFSFEIKPLERAPSGFFFFFVRAEFGVLSNEAERCRVLQMAEGYFFTHG